MRRIAWILGTAMIASPVVAQEDVVSPAPGLGVERVLREQESANAQAKAAPLAPSGGGAQPGVVGAAQRRLLEELGLSGPGLPTPTSLPEGTFLLKRSGRLFASSAGIVFVPDPVDAGVALGPLILHFCEMTSRVEIAMGARSGQEEGAGMVSAPAVLSGQVFARGDRRYLLPTVFSLSARDATPGPAVGATQPAVDPSVSDLIRDLESRRAEPRAISTAAAAPVESEGPADLLPDGTLIATMRARLIRTVGGDSVLSFDGDGQSPNIAPVVVLPCRALERLERMIAAKGDALSFTVSGRVFAYRKRNYILPSLFQVLPDMEIGTRQ